MDRGLGGNRDHQNWCARQIEDKTKPAAVMAAGFAVSKG
jgi:hypothetical protein